MRLGAIPRLVPLLLGLLVLARPALGQVGTEFWLALPRARSIDDMCYVERGLDCDDRGWNNGSGAVLSDQHPGYAVVIRNDGPSPVQVKIQYRDNGQWKNLWGYVGCTCQDCAPDDGVCELDDCEDQLEEVLNVQILPESSIDVTVPRNGLPAPYNQPRFEPDEDLDGNVVLPNKGLLITSTGDVSVIAYNRLPFYKPHNDAFRVLPASKLGTDYLCTTWGTDRGPAEYDPGSVAFRTRITILATQPNTGVTIDVPDRDPAQQPGYNQPLSSIVLQEGGVYHYYDDNLFDASERDVHPGQPGPDGEVWEKAVRVQSTEPVAVFVSSDSAEPFIDGTTAVEDHDAMADQALPVASWGTDFLVPESIVAFQTGFTFKIVAAEAGTRVGMYVTGRCSGDTRDPQLMTWINDPEIPPVPIKIGNFSEFYHEATIFGAVLLNAGDSFEPRRDMVNATGGPDWLRCYSDPYAQPPDAQPRLFRIHADKPIGIVFSPHTTKNHGDCFVAEAFQATVPPVNEFDTFARFSALPFFTMAGCALPRCNLTCDDLPLIGTPMRHFAVIVRSIPDEVPWSGALLLKDSDGDVVAQLTDGSTPDARFSGWFPYADLPVALPHTGAQSYALGWYLLHEDDNDDPDTAPQVAGLGDYSIECDGQTIPFMVYVTAVSPAGSIGYPAWLTPAPPPPLTNIVLTDKIEFDSEHRVEVVPESFVGGEPAQLNLAEETTLVWLLTPEQIPANVGETRSFEYDVLIRNPVPGEQREVSRVTTLEYLDSGATPPHRVLEIGPRHVLVGPSVAELAIEATPELVVSPGLVALDVTFEPNGAQSRAVFGSLADFQSEDVTLTGLEAGTMPRPDGLVLARVTGEEGPFVESGTARFIVDAGRTVRWGGLTLTRGTDLDSTGAGGAAPPEAVRWRVKGAPTREALLGIPGGYSGWSEAPSAPVLAGEPAMPIETRFLAVEVELTAAGSGDIVSPVLEQLDVEFTSNSYAIDVTVEDDEDGLGETQGQLVELVARYPLTPEELASPLVSFTRYFQSSHAVPGPYRARATLVDTAVPQSDLTATDAFTIASESIGQVLANSIATDRQEYETGQIADIISTVTNRSVNIPVQQINVLVDVTSPEGDQIHSYSYRIDYLPGGNTDHVHHEPLQITAQMSPLEDYVVEQRIVLSGVVELTDETLFDVLSSGQLLTAVEGTIVAEPPVLNAPAVDLTLDLDATNVGNVDLTEVTLRVEIQEAPPQSGCTNPQSLADPIDLYVGALPRGASVGMDVPYEIVGLINGQPTRYCPGTYVATLRCRAPQLGNGVEWVTLSTSGFYVSGEQEPVPDPVYIALDLGTLPGHVASRALGFAATGDIVGASVTSGGADNAALWRCGRIISVHSAIPSAAVSVAHAVNNDGMVVGWYKKSDGTKAFRWNSLALSGGFEAFPMLNDTGSAAYDINSLGKLSNAVGSWDPSAGPLAAFMWSITGQFQSLTGPGGSGGISAALGVNDGGDLAGYWSPAPGQPRRGLIYQDSVMLSAGVLAGHTETILEDINAAAAAAGYAVGTPLSTAVRAQSAALMALSRSGSAVGKSTYAYAIGPDGDVVGLYGTPGSDTRGCLWRGTRMIDLNDRLVGGMSCWTIDTAMDVDGSGRIVGQGRRGAGSPRAVLLEPAPFEASAFDSLRLWTRADVRAERGAGTLVSTWHDITCGDDNLAQASGIGLPVWEQGSCCAPILRFSDATLETPDLAIAGSGTLFLVADIPPGAGIGAPTPLLSAQSASGAFELVVANRQLLVNRQGAGGPVTVLSAEIMPGLTAIALRADGPELSLYLNGDVEDSVQLGGGETLSLGAVRLARDLGGAVLGECGIAEVLVFEDAVTEAQRLSIGAYLSGRYGAMGSGDILDPELWFRADSGIEPDSSVRVTRWRDRATDYAAVIQQEPTDRPAWAEAQAECRPVVRFDGLDDFLAREASAAPADVLFLIDVSGSMKRQLYAGQVLGSTLCSTTTAPYKAIDMAREAVELLSASLLSAGDCRVAFELFGNVTPSVIISGTNSEGCYPDALEPRRYGYPGPNGPTRSLFGPGQAALMQEAICAIPAEHVCYQNNSYFATALDWATANFHSDRRRVVVFISDGQPNDAQGGAVVQAAAEAMGQAGIVLYTLGCNIRENDNNAIRTMRDMAETWANSGGRFYRINEPAALATAIQEITDDVTHPIATMTAHLVFKADTPGPDQADPELLVALGSRDTRGISITVDAGHVSVSAWDQTTTQGALPWFGTTSAAVQANRTYDLEAVIETTAAAEGSTTLEIRLDGVPVGSPFVVARGGFQVDVNEIAFGGLPAQLGAGEVSTRFPGNIPSAAGHNYFFDGDTAELLIYSRVLDPESGQQVRDYLADRYGLSPPENIHPLASAGPDRVIEDRGWNGVEAVHLDASQSVDLDGPLGGGAFEWFSGGVSLGAGPTLTVELPLGTHIIELRATDASGGVDTDRAVVTVRPLSSGVVGHWRLDAAANPGVAPDSSPNGFHAVVAGALAGDFPDGRADEALEISGSLFVDLAETAAAGRLPAGNAPRTIAGWFEADKEGGTDEAFYGQLGDDDESALSITASATSVGVRIGDHVQGVTSLDLSPGWHHVALVIPAGAEWSDQVLLYLDGEPLSVAPIGESLQGPVPIDTGSDAASFGRSILDQSLRQFGRMDDLQIFAREIDPAGLVASVPHAHWKFNEGAGASAADTTRLVAGTGNDVTLDGADWTDGATGAGALSFAGTSATAETLAAPLDPSVDEFTVALFVRSPDGPVITQRTGGKDVLWLALDGATAYTGLRGDGVAELECQFVDGGWHHIIMSVSAASVEVFIDGQYAATLEDVGGGAATGALVFGGVHDDTGLEFTGDLDDIRLYRWSMTREEAGALFERIAGQP